MQSFFSGPFSAFGMARACFEQHFNSESRGGADRWQYEDKACRDSFLHTAMPSDNSPARKGFQTMRNQAYPTESKIERMPSRVDRKVLCADYERCLDEAVRKNWSGFSCRKCHAFRPLRLNSSEWRLDSLACIVLINVAEFTARFKQKPRGGTIERLQRIQSRGEVLGLG
jgi:hypothetical protein